MITPKIKDDVLRFISTNAPVERICGMSPNEFISSSGVTFDEANAVLSYFERIGFIDSLNFNRQIINFRLMIEATDYFSRGGFEMQEEMMKANLEKLLLEIDNLKKQLEPQNLAKLEKISNIAQTLFSAINIFQGGNS